MYNVRFSYLFVALVFAFRLVAATPAEPRITSVSLDGTNVIVKVSAPAGVRKITIEGRARVEASTWAPKAVRRFEAATIEAQDIIFNIPRSANLEVLRVRADATEVLPTAFFKGTNQFSGPQSSTATPPGGRTVLDGGLTPDAGAGNQIDTRTVVESDIWKVSGDTLYFFNNLRGLQVLDISNPAAPVLKGTFSIPASGEQMYVLPSGHAVLLTRNWCGSGNNDSKVLIVDGAGAAPAFSAEASVPGWIIESRMVGSALYLVSQDYLTRTNETGGISWESVNLLTSIDLSNPSAPVKRNSQKLPGYSNTIYATDRFLVSVYWNNQYSGSDLQLVDISSSNGEFTLISTIHVAGAVADKFKINIEGDILSVISQSWDDANRWTTMLENFSIAAPAKPVKVGFLRLAQGEQLHAARFDGERVYIVTFLRIDPLWIVDNSNARDPKIVGELHVNGWSTYLQPLGDRVVALGIDDTNSWRVAVSLFDVSDTSAPKLLSKVALGENASWSEANYDEKALTVLPDAGLILVPFTGYTTNGQASHVQLIDLAQDSLRARGQISDHLYPRRATLHRDHIVSISGREFISYDAANRDEPTLKARVDLAWPVNKVLFSGDYLIEIENGSRYGWYYSSPTRSVIRIAQADHPETILSSVTLTSPLPIAGAELRDHKLYIAQAQSYSFYPWAIFDAAGSETPTNPPATFVLSIWDASQLPGLTKISETTPEIPAEFGSMLTALWPKPNLLVWSGGNQFFGWRFGGPMFAVDGIGIGFPGFWGAGGGQLAAFDVSDAQNPSLKSFIDITTNGWSFSKPFVAEGLVYLSHQNTEAVPLDPTVTSPVSGIPPPPIPNGGTDTTTTNTDTTVPGWGGGTNPPPVIFVTRYFLDVIDYTDAANPVVRKPVNIPGSLQGASHAGGVVYTLGMHFNPQGGSDGTEWLDASAYDGVSAFLIDSRSLTNWPRTIVVNVRDIFIGGPTSLERWQLGDEGMFAKLSATDTKEPVYNLRFIGDLAGLVTSSKIALYDATDRNNLKLIGQSSVSCNGGSDLDDSDGSLQRGLWVPLSDYGVEKIDVAPAGQ
jgi:hypothetical protein